jgi:predicted GH43/DUF377 family glycosyl hydrolase
MPHVAVTRTTHRLLHDPCRVITKPHLPGEEIYAADGKSRVQVVLNRILAIPERDAVEMLGDVLGHFSQRHRDFHQTLLDNFKIIEHHVEPGCRLSEERCLLIGAYFTHEYSIEGAALFNPSMVPAPDQDGLASGQLRFIMSVRAVGEGHVSSIGFRSGVIDGQCGLAFDPVSRYAETGAREPPLYDKHLFGVKLKELGADPNIVTLVLDPLLEQFTLDDLEQRLTSLGETYVPHTTVHDTVKIAHLLASSNYVIKFPSESAPSERIIFPGGPRETHGMEDARFVRFKHDDGSITYYATYTAFDGIEIMPQLIETRDFLSFRICTLNGARAQNKGMALFPRLIGGKYTMLSRIDRESLHLMRSDNVRLWNDARVLHAPQRPWELIQIGNCGSPIETDAGWLVLMHGVGPMRRYSIGAMLLDLDDPSRLIGHLPEPLMTPEEDEREGYVPNVLYSCGAMAHADRLVIPYAFSDVGIRIALVDLAELLERLSKNN